MHTMTPGSAGLVSRRRFLGSLAAAVVGAAPAGAIAYGLVRGALESGGSSGVSSRQLLGLPDAPTAGTTAAATVARRVFHSRPDLTPPVVSADVPAGRVAPGYVFLTPNNGAGPDGPAIVDNTGELVWMRPDATNHATDLRVAAYRGQPVLTWWEGTTNGGIGSGECVIADTSYQEIARIRAANGRTIDLHELQITPQGTALFFADAAVDGSQRLAGGSPLPWQVMDCSIQEVDIATGALLWEWHAIDHIGLDESFVGQPTSNRTVYDYVHTNSIQVLPDDSLLVSARNTSTIYRIDRPSGTIRWRLGGRRSDFSIGAGAAFGWQHDARWRPDGTITVFDDEAPPVPARALVLRVDEDARTVEPVRALTRRQPDLVSSQGSVQLLDNANLFVGWGSTPYCSEFAPDGTLQFDAAFPAANQSYRAFRFEWHAAPIDEPALAVERSGDALTVYASWNGATEVARWDVLGGPDPARLSVAGSAQRTGFETAIRVPAGPSLVAVRAMDAAGRPLGTSQPIRPSTTAS